MVKDGQVHGVREGDEADLGALVGKAADQLRMVGGQATASVRFCVDGQWFVCTLRLIEVVEVSE